MPPEYPFQLLFCLCSPTSAITKPRLLPHFGQKEARNPKMTNVRNVTKIYAVLRQEGREKVVADKSVTSWEVGKSDEFSREANVSTPKAPFKLRAPPTQSLSYNLR